MPLILGAESTGEAHPILVDTSGRVLIAQPTPADLLIGAHGYDGSAWQKLLVDSGGRLLLAPPASIIQQRAAATVASDWTAETTLLSYTVTTGKTLYILAFFVDDNSNAAGVEFKCRLLIAGGVTWTGRAVAGGSYHVPLPSPLKATSAQVVALGGTQGSGGAKTLSAGFVGYEI